MVTTVYLDALFLLSGTMDYCLLFICGKLADASVSKVRLLGGASVGALYSVAVLLFYQSILSALLTKLAVSLSIVFLSYGFGKIARYMRLWCTYLVSNFALIGCVLAIGWIRDKDPFSMRFSSLVIAGIFFYAASSFLIKRIARPRDRDATVLVEFCGKNCTLHALVDTGNLVKDPLSGAPVIVAELSSLKDLFDPKTYAMFECAEPENYPYLIETLTFAHRMRLIPYHTVGTASALMLAFRPDCVFVNRKRFKNVLVAFSPTCISKFGEFDALVGVGEE